MPANRSAAWPAPTWSRIAFCNRVPGDALKLIRLGQRRLASATPTEDNDPDKGVTHVPLPCDTHVSWLNTAQEVLEVVESDLYPRLETIYADTKYHNYALYEWIEDNVDYRLHIVRRPEGAEGFVPLPQRWVAERTFAWLGRSRRLSKDHEKLTETSETMIKIALIHMMVRRLASDTPVQTFAYRECLKKVA